MAGESMSGVNNGKFVIDFRWSQVRHMLLCIHLTVMKNALINVLHCIKLLQSLHRLDNSFIISYSTSLTQYLTYSTSLPQDTFDLLYFNFFFFDRNVYQCVWIDIWMHGTLYQRPISQDYSGSTVKEEAFNVNLLYSNKHC